MRVEKKQLHLVKGNNTGNNSVVNVILLDIVNDSL